MGGAPNKQCLMFKTAVVVRIGSDRCAGVPDREDAGLVREGEDEEWGEVETSGLCLYHKAGKTSGRQRAEEDEHKRVGIERRRRERAVRGCWCCVPRSSARLDCGLILWSKIDVEATGMDEKYCSAGW